MGIGGRGVRMREGRNANSSRESAPSRKRTWLLVVLLCLLGLGLIVIVPAVAFHSLWSASVAAELTSTVRSPSGEWEVRTYYINPGAMGSSSGRVDLVRMQDGHTRILWTGPPLPSAPQWLDNSTVLVGEQRLNVHGKQTNSDSAPVGGFSDPQQAVEHYLVALAAGDLEAVQRAYRQIVTRQTLPRLQRRRSGRPLASMFSN